MTAQNIEPCGEADVYREEILDHSRQPRNKQVMIDATFKSQRRNMSCGDSMEIFVKLGEGEKVAQLTFDGVGCAISQATASMLTEEATGKTLDEIMALSERDIFELLGTEVGPARIRCAMLALETLKKGIEEYRK
ncbi:iron-sulfur cluster assembly scaffold protein [Patescibacteria group bacterium]|nr:iron-sulfur cluster assembly scaffold protein [Patescibacteria group bacterium]MBU1029030.1 iron-sulfur cluster assembly scaffold protein [Patescibacteria group bacterium]MBU1916374.1 iron-sulfur cluster assembly scaffold protein [Patescibacteria group bacterium]